MKGRALDTGCCVKSLCLPWEAGGLSPRIQGSLGPMGPALLAHIYEISTVCWTMRYRMGIRLSPPWEARGRVAITSMKWGADRGASLIQEQLSPPGWSHTRHRSFRDSSKAASNCSGLCPLPTCLSL
jgi:hypothetical protein